MLVAAPIGSALHVAERSPPDLGFGQRYTVAAAEVDETLPFAVGPVGVPHGFLSIEWTCTHIFSNGVLGYSSFAGILYFVKYRDPAVHAVSKFHLTRFRKMSRLAPLDRGA